MKFTLFRRSDVSITSVCASQRRLRNILRVVSTVFLLSRTNSAVLSSEKIMKISKSCFVPSLSIPTQAMCFSSVLAVKITAWTESVHISRPISGIILSISTAKTWKTSTNTAWKFSVRSQKKQARFAARKSIFLSFVSDSNAEEAMGIRD